MLVPAATHQTLIQSAAKGANAPWQRDLAAFDAELAKRESAFTAEHVSGDTMEGAKLILAHLLDLDQFSRKGWDLPHEHGYSGTEAEIAFIAAFQPRQKRVDDANLRIFKPLLKRWGWFTLGDWGRTADTTAWAVVQHADDDRSFQKTVLAILEPLAASGQTDPSHFALLFDRVAVNDHRLQRFGTQGFCTGPGTWKPRPIEDPAHVDERRKAMGLQPLADYIASFKGICHEDETERALKALPLPGK